MATTTVRNGIDVDQLLGTIKAIEDAHAANAAAQSPNATRRKLTQLCQYVQDTSPVRDIIANAVPVETSLKIE